MEDSKRYLNHLASLSAAMGVAACASSPDTAPSTGIKPQGGNQVQVVVGTGVHAEELDQRFWPYRAFPDATFVRIYLPYRSSSGQGDQPEVQYLVKENPRISKGAMQTRVEIVRRRAEQSEQAESPGQTPRPD
jgi:hypothetical protein